MTVADADRVIDPWSPLSHKPLMSAGRVGQLAPGWVGNHARRLAAYKVLASYFHNVQRQFQEVNPSSEARDALRQYREFGDPKTFRDAIVSALMGTDPPECVVEGADDEPADDDPDRQARVALAEAKAKRQAELRVWSGREQAGRKLFQCERHAVGLGDGVHVFRVDYEAGRVRVDVYDPGFYFPVLVESHDGYPLKVHLAWEFDVEDPERHRTDTYVRRQTWELVRLTADDAGVRVDTVGEGDQAFTRWVRDYAYNLDDDGSTVVPSPWKCVHSNGVWKKEDIREGTVERFPLGNAVQWATNAAGTQIRDLDLGIDFIPVLHTPNTPADEHHYGESCLSNIAQLQDEIALNDTDASRAAATTGVPILAASGVAVDRLTIVPGRVVNLGDPQAKLSVVDTTAGLKALMERATDLLDRRDANGRVPSAILGRVDPGQIDAGVILALSFGPLRALVGEMQLVRVEKHELYWKIVQRLSIVAGFYEDKRVYPATWATGSILPTDEAGFVTMVVGMVAAKVLSTETAIRWLQAQGFAYEGIGDELDRIRAGDFAGAADLFAALGSLRIVAEYLGFDEEAITQIEDEQAARAARALDLGEAHEPDDAPPGGTSTGDG